MESIRQYIFTLICMSLICMLLPEFFENGSGLKKQIQFVAGILMILTVLAPLVGNRITLPEFYIDGLSDEAQHAITTGQEDADDMFRKIIIERTQAYILDKSASMGADISVELTLTDAETPTPETVTLCGTVSPYVKKKLTRALISDLGISEDKLQWN